MIVPFYLLFPPLISGFLFGSNNEIQRCYELDLEHCFREAFYSAVHPPMRFRREFNQYATINITTLDKRKGRGNKNYLLCHDVRRFGLCFHFPGCSEQMAASIASVQYHMIFGKKLPMHAFLAYRGFGKQMCEQSCSRDSMLSCRRSLTDAEQQEEQGFVLEASGMVQQISTTKDSSSLCDRFKRSLLQILRYRHQYCGDVAKCTCKEPKIEEGVAFCNLGCEHLLHVEMHNLANVSLIHNLSFLSFILLIIFIRI